MGRFGCDTGAPGPSVGKGVTVVDDVVLDWRYKGLPERASGMTADSLCQLEIDILRGDCLMPVAILKDSALSANSEFMSAFVEQTGARLAPHGKTTMSPELFRMQLAGGAWAITAATASHVRMYRQFGIQRIFMANQLVGRGNVDLVLAEMKADTGLEFYALVDSVEGVELLTQAAQAHDVGRPLKLLVEVGAMGCRTGVRDHETGLAVARAVAAASPWLALVGVEAFEGVFQSGAAPVQPVEEMLERLLRLASAAKIENLFEIGEILLSAGGSGFFDLCAERLSQAGLADAVVVIRSGCYIAHDHGIYERLVNAMRERGSKLPKRSLKPALEVWTVIQSVPEPGRAIAAMGKRDVGQDVDMPRPMWWFREGEHETPVELSPDHEVTALYDQHAYVDGPSLLKVGDLVGFGVSHPCTTFDKWKMIYTVDDEYRVTGAVTTCF